MGLDMYLTGSKSLHQRYSEPDKAMKIDGFFVDAVKLELGYWRKHPNLHGFIVQTFAGGVDECQQIPLQAADLRRIITGIEVGALPHTEGFFFGVSAGTKEERDEDIATFRKALEWLEAQPKGGDDKPLPEWRSVYYQASW